MNKKNYILFAALCLLFLTSGIACRNKPGTTNASAQDTTYTFAMNFRQLTPEEKYVIENKGTEYPGTGTLLHEHRAGIYHCKRCNAPLYRSEDKFDSHCGWPAFDDEIQGAVIRIPDADGQRTEIQCARCHAHLGLVFEGEGFTSKNTRHCVNSISMVFVPLDVKSSKPKTMKAYFSCGCFWGAEFYFNRATGVLSTTVGYMGGHTDNPTYEEVCSHTTGHLETTEIEYDPQKTTYESLVRLFFEIHDFTQKDGQGPDIGEQYLSAIFVQSDEERAVVEKVIAELKQMNYDVATTIRTDKKFWPAEAHHQDYYDRNGHRPYCHARRQIFGK